MASRKLFPEHQNPLPLEANLPSQDFTKDIIPIPCHSHNDEQEQRVPLYTALATGCTAIEADIHPGMNLTNHPTILVGHSASGLQKGRSLSSLYLTPLLSILRATNNASSAPSPWAGIYATSPNTSLVLMLDFKSLAPNFWPLVEAQLSPLRDGGWLTHWANNTLTRGAITVVASGDATLDVVTANNTYRDIFLDAPLLDVANASYTAANSYYASVNIDKATGYLWFGQYSKGQERRVQGQIEAAAAKGLVSRYWNTIDKPVSWRYGTWKTLVRSKVGILNVDDLDAARRWDWCGIAGFRAC